MLVDIKEIKEFILNTETSAYELEKHIPLTRAAISRYRSGDSDIMNMTLVKALEIQEYINKKYRVYSVDQYGNEWEEDSFSTLEKSKAAAYRCWNHLTGDEQKTRVVQVRTDINEFGFDVAFELNHDIQKAIEERNSCEDEYYLIVDSKDAFDDEDEYLEELNEAKEYLENAKAKLNKLTQ